VTKPGAVIRIPITLIGEADPARFEAALEQLAALDRQLEIARTPVRQRVILGGMSERHLELAADRLIREHGLQLQFGAPEIAYLETISRTIEQDYTHKRQSGGTGQFARIRIRFEPLPPGTGYKFENAVVGGSVPRDFVPGVEKGLAWARAAGPIAGFPVTDFQATLLDGAYHEVDSSALTFELAARGCFKEGISLARPVLLEPVMQMEIEVPAESGDAVVADLETRRAITLRSVDRGSNKLVTALVPLSNLFGYENQMRGLTKGAGSVRMQFDHYAPTYRPGPDDPHPGAAIGLRPA
jgi:elongation factor G